MEMQCFIYIKAEILKYLDVKMRSRKLRIYVIAHI